MKEFFESIKKNNLERVVELITQNNNIINAKNKVKLFYFL
jgi:hypothetical protein